MSGLWGWFANAGSSVFAGLAMLAILMACGKHRDKNGKALGAKMTMIVLQGAALYTLIICVLGNWALHIPVSDTINKGFSNERISWIMLGLLGDIFVRIYSLFDPE